MSQTSQYQHCNAPCTTDAICMYVCQHYLSSHKLFLRVAFFSSACCMLNANGMFFGAIKELYLRIYFAPRLWIISHFLRQSCREMYEKTYMEGTYCRHPFFGNRLSFLTPPRSFSRIPNQKSRHVRNIIIRDFLRSYNGCACWVTFCFL